MAVIVKDLGIASAYGYAKSKGYTGTEEEFAELMASYADVAQQAEAAAQDAEDAKDEAVTAKTDAQTAKTAAQAAQSASETASGAASTKASEAAQSAQAASGSATAAQTSATAAAGSAQTAQAAAQTATTKASEASSSASAASTAKTGAETARTGAQTAQTAAETAQENAEAAAASVSASAAQIEQNTADIGAIKNDLTQLSDEMPNKANIDGSYDNMTVGNAKQLVATVGITDKTPYNFRTSGGSVDIGDREVDKVVGGTVAWNQHSDNSRQTTTLNGITFTNNGDGSITVNGTADATTTFNSIEHTEDNAIYGHIYLIAGCPSGFSGCYLQDPMSAGSQNVDYGSGRVIKRTSESTRLLTQIYVQGNATITNAVFKPQLFDLTQMFGSTIADYIYGLEQSQAGAGVAWFRKLFPKPYYAYDAGSLQSVQTSEHKMVGFNQWDEQWEVGGINHTTGENVSVSTAIRSKNYIPCLPSVTYYFCNKSNAGSPYIHYYDANKAFMSYAEVTRSTTFTTPNGACYIRFNMDTGYGTTYKNDICINLSWDGEKDGQYEPYVEHTYPLDADVVLRGIPKLDASNNLYYDGDEYTPSGQVSHRFNEVVLDGSENWAADSDRTGINSGTVYHRFYITKNDMYKPSGSVGYKGHILSTISTTWDGYVNDDPYTISMSVTGYTGPSDNYLYIIVNSTLSNIADVAQLKTWLSNNPLPVVYELATPTTETADPFTNPQIVDDFGTEEYVDAGVTASTPIRDVAIPVGHETVYQANLRAKLEMAPNSPDGDGDYIVRQTNGENEYVLLEEELPSAPSSDGTYVLKATVASGTVTLTWVEET